MYSNSACSCSVVIERKLVINFENAEFHDV